MLRSGRLVAQLTPVCHGMTELADAARNCQRRAGPSPFATRAAAAAALASAHTAPALAKVVPACRRRDTDSGSSLLHRRMARFLTASAWMRASHSSRLRRLVGTTSRRGGNAWQGPCNDRIAPRSGGRLGGSGSVAALPPSGRLAAQSWSPAVADIIDGRLAWTVTMISSLSWQIEVVPRLAWPSWRWITLSGTPSRASSMRGSSD